MDDNGWYINWMIMNGWHRNITSGWCFGTWNLCFRLLGISSSQLTFTPSFFRGVGQPPTRHDLPCTTGCSISGSFVTNRVDTATRFRWGPHQRAGAPVRCKRIFGGGHGTDLYRFSIKIHPFPKNKLTVVLPMFYHVLPIFLMCVFE